MKYLKKKKHPILPWAIAALVLVVLILVLTLLPGGEHPEAGETTAPTGETLASDPTDGTAPTGESVSIEPGTESTGEPTEEPTEAPTTEPTYAPKEDVKIQTPYGTLVYPGEWGGLLQVDKVNGDPYQVVFTAKLDSGVRQELFTIGFGGARDGALGTVKVSGKDVFVHVLSVDFKPAANWTDNDISTIYSMQEALNELLGAMNIQPLEQPQATQPETLPPEDDEDMTIDTPKGELHYPARWNDSLRIEIRQETVCSVEFYCTLEGFEDVLLFIIHFGGEEGFDVMDFTCADGTTVALHMTICEIEPDINWTDAQKTLVFAMQEDLNYLLAALSK